MKKIAIKQAISEVKIPKTDHASARRAINKVLKRSTGRIPRPDLIDILKIISSAL